MKNQLIFGLFCVFGVVSMANANIAPPTPKQSYKQIEQVMYDSLYSIKEDGSFNGSNRLFSKPIVVSSPVKVYVQNSQGQGRTIEHLDNMGVKPRNDNKVLNDDGTEVSSPNSFSSKFKQVFDWFD